jgi:predicted alpha/beta-hydrolase family hydrolase
MQPMVAAGQWMSATAARCRRRRVRACAALVSGAALAVSLACAAVPDDARESRWADEVVPQLVVGEAVWLATPSRAKVLALHAEPAGKPKAAVVLVHGLGVHPDFGMIGALRTGLADRGYETLSVQMPVLASDAPRDGYRDLFGAAGERIGAAAAWLRARGANRIVLVSHSMGSAMSGDHLAQGGAAKLDGWVAIGMAVDFATTPTMPVADVVAERDLPEVLSMTAARAKRMPSDRCSRRITVAGADHYFESTSASLIAAILPFLDRVAAGDCTR